MNINKMKFQIQKWLKGHFPELLLKFVLSFFLYLLSLAGVLLILKEMLLTPVPLWLLCLISLTILFGCVTLWLIFSRSSLKPNLKFIDYGGVAWKVIYLSKYKIKIDPVSCCIEHHVQHTQEVHNYICPKCGTDNVPSVPYFPENMQEIYKDLSAITEQIFL